jgi:two-component system cell cycle response regulator DivK
VKRKVILSAEDNDANRKIIRDLFSKKGYTIVEAIDGEEAIAMVKKIKPDIVLMDIQLPKISGYEAAETIKADPDLRHIPIIAVTSYALSGDEEKAFEAGCDEYVTKPFRPKVLLEIVEKYLN